MPIRKFGYGAVTFWQAHCCQGPNAPRDRRNPGPPFLRSGPWAGWPWASPSQPGPSEQRGVPQVPGAGAGGGMGGGDPGDRGRNPYPNHRFDGGSGSRSRVAGSEVTGRNELWGTDKANRLTRSLEYNFLHWSSHCRRWSQILKSELFATLKRNKGCFDARTRWI